MPGWSIHREPRGSFFSHEGLRCNRRQVLAQERAAGGRLPSPLVEDRPLRPLARPIPVRLMCIVGRHCAGERDRKLLRAGPHGGAGSRVPNLAAGAGSGSSFDTADEPIGERQREQLAVAQGRRTVPCRSPPRTSRSEKDGGSDCPSFLTRHPKSGHRPNHSARSPPPAAGGVAE